MENIWDIFKIDDDNLNNNNENIKSNINPNNDDKNQLKIDKKYLCESCNENSLIYIDGNFICNTCGVFQKKRLSNDIEYRYYGDGDSKNTNPTRVGMPTNCLLPQSSIGTQISLRNNEKFFIRRMIKYDNWGKMPYKERSRNLVFNEISRVAKLHDLPQIIIEQSKIYYKIISENSLSRGANRNGLIASCIFMACKNEKVPRTSKEISEIFNIDIHDMTKGCKKFKELIRLSDCDIEINNTTSNPLDYIDRFCSNLNISLDTKNIAEFVTVMILAVIPYVVDDNTSPSIAAVSIYIVCTFCNKEITKKQISKSCKISEVTISKCYKKIEPYIHVLLPNKLLNK